LWWVTEAAVGGVGPVACAAVPLITMDAMATAGSAAIPAIALVKRGREGEDIC
jgi:hypothetical protein